MEILLWKLWASGQATHKIQAKQTLFLQDAKDEVTMHRAHPYGLTIHIIPIGQRQDSGPSW